MRRRGQNYTDLRARAEAHPPADPRVDRGPGHDLGTGALRSHVTVAAVARDVYESIENFGNLAGLSL
jgi:hypothetical protein